MEGLIELEKRINRLIACNNLELVDKDNLVIPLKCESLDSYEFGFSMALHFVLEVIDELKNKSV